VVTKLVMVRKFDTVLTKFNAVGIFWLTLCTLKLCNCYFVDLVE